MNFIPRNSNFSTFGRGAINLQANKGEYLSIEDIQRRAPAVFAEGAHSSRSERFVHFATHELLRGLIEQGFVPVRVSVGGSSDVEKRNFTKHAIRLRRIEDISNQTPKVGDSIPEVVLRNAHDGTSAYALDAALYRLICSNGMVVSDKQFGSIKVGHTGKNAIDKVIEGTYTVISDAQLALERAQELRAIELTPSEQVLFGNEAKALRFEGPVAEQITGEQVVRARRSADLGSSLWLTFNRAQENLVRGGLNYHVTSAKGDVQNRESRPVRSVDGDFSLNKDLWALTQDFASWKASKVA